MPEFTFDSYSGADMTAVVNIKDETGQIVKAYNLLDVQTISFSVHRDKVPVRSLGNSLVQGFTYGNITIGGSLIFTIMDQNHNIISPILDRYIQGTGTNSNKYINLTAEVPPFDIRIVLRNEKQEGRMHRLIIKNCTVIDEGQVHSIEDLMMENTMSFTATDIESLSQVNSNKGTSIGLGYNGTDNNYYENDAIKSTIQKTIQKYDNQLKCYRKSVIMLSKMLDETKASINDPIGDAIVSSTANQLRERIKSLNERIVELENNIINYKRSNPVRFSTSTSSPYSVQLTDEEALHRVDRN